MSSKSKEYKISLIYSEQKVSLNDIVKRVLKENLKKYFQMICNLEKNELVCNYTDLLLIDKEGHC